jgi:hypothetical protein
LKTCPSLCDSQGAEVPLRAQPLGVLLDCLGQTGRLYLGVSRHSNSEESCRAGERSGHLRPLIWVCWTPRCLSPASHLRLQFPGFWLSVRLLLAPPCCPHFLGPGDTCATDLLSTLASLLPTCAVLLHKILWLHFRREEK